MTAETVWEIEPHTKAKHELLERYLSAWFPILGSWNDRLLVIDGFAGPGHYRGGERGSPSVAIGAALRNQRTLGKTRVKFRFNEADTKRYNELSAWIDDQHEALPPTVLIESTNMKFGELAETIVGRRGDRVLVPTFAFVDPFGWSDLPMQLICDLVRDQRSELFILFSYNSLNRWIGVEDHRETMEALFGCSDFTGAIGLAPDARKEFLASLYGQQLKRIGRFEHVSRFEMIERRGRTSYFLFHCTRSLKGLEVMRSTMWKIDPESGCRFSDVAAGLEPLFEIDPEIKLDQDLVRKFSGQDVPMPQLKEFVLTGTRYAPEHLKKLTLKPMQERGEIEVFNQKSRGTFPDRAVVRFL